MILSANNPTMKPFTHCAAILMAVLTATTIPSQAEVQCLVNQASLAFAPYDVFNPAPTDGIGTVQLRCMGVSGSGGAMATLAIAMGPGRNGSEQRRQLASAGHALDYGLYSDAAHSRSWASGAEALLLPLPALQVQETRTLNLPVYGRIPARQNVGAGAYSDSLSITVSP